MHNGHRGINHPVINIETGKCEVTSQNHGFGIDANDVNNNENVKVTHRRTISLGLNFIDTLLTTLDINRRPPIICRRMSWRQLSAHVLMKGNSAQRAGTDPGSSVSQRLYLSSRQTNSPEYALGYSRQSSSRPPLLPSILQPNKKDRRSPGIQRSPELASILCPTTD